MLTYKKLREILINCLLCAREDNSRYTGLSNLCFNFSPNRVIIYSCNGHMALKYTIKQQLHSHECTVLLSGKHTRHLLDVMPNDDKPVIIFTPGEVIYFNSFVYDQVRCDYPVDQLIKQFESPKLSDNITLSLNAGYLSEIMRFFSKNTIVKTTMYKEQCQFETTTDDDIKLTALLMADG